MGQFSNVIYWLTTTYSKYHNTQNRCRNITSNFPVFLQLNVSLSIYYTKDQSIDIGKTLQHINEYINENSYFGTLTVRRVKEIQNKLAEADMRRTWKRSRLCRNIRLCKIVHLWSIFGPSRSVTLQMLI